jgi:hypothetical protein
MGRLVDPQSPPLAHPIGTTQGRPRHDLWTIALNSGRPPCACVDRTFVKSVAPAWRGIFSGGQAAPRHNDSVALAVLLVGIGFVELIVLSI